MPIFDFYTSLLEVAEMVLSRCVSTNYITDSTGHKTPDQITYFFGFLDDFDTPYRNIKDFMKHMGLVQSTSNTHTSEQYFNYDALALAPTENNNNSKIESNTIDRLMEQDHDSEESWLQQHYNTENHVLNLMVSVQYKQKLVDFINCL